MADTASVSGKAPSRASDDVQQMMLPPSSSKGAVLNAASAPCLIAELTSHIDNRAIADFFYTYRAYMTSHDLLRLLIMRFKWALQPSVLPDDEAKRKIVKVRTYAVIKYWITNFFAMDYLPNRLLRLQLTDWLNSMSHDPDLQQRPADMAIVKSLKKVVRSLKADYEKTGIGGLLSADGGQTPRLPQSISSSSGLEELAGEVNVSLELGEDVGEEMADSPTQVRSPISNKSRTPIVASSPTESRTNSNNRNTAVGHLPPPLPMTQSPISRAFLTTFSRLSRFKRHLNSRVSTNPFFNENIDGLDYDTNNCGDLLFMRGGLESFLDFFELRTPKFATNSRPESVEEGQHPASDAATTAHEEGTPSLSSNQTRSTPASSFDLGQELPLTSNHPAPAFGLGISHDKVAEIRESDVGIALSSGSGHPASIQSFARDDKSDVDRASDVLHHFQSDQTLRSASRTQHALRSASTTSYASEHIRNAFGPSSTIVQIDDFDPSSDEEDGMARRALRRLPGARDLRMAQNVTELEPAPRHSFESVYSLGCVYDPSRRWLASYYGGTPRPSGGADDSREESSTARETRKATVMTSEMLDPDEALSGYELVKGFKIEHLEESDEEEAGDVEAALRRLEGVIDEEKQQERARKVERMWQRSQVRQTEAVALTQHSRAASTPSVQREESDVTDLDSATDVESARPEGANVAQTKDGSMRSVAALAPTPRLSLPPLDGNQPHVARYRLPRSMWAPPPLHRSFMLDYHSSVIAQQFSLIEVELFRAVSWQEMVSGQWKMKHHDGQVLDWEAFYQARARRRVAVQKSARRSSNSVGSQSSTSPSSVAADASASADAGESSVEAIMARFDLMCNWVASEVVMTSTVDMRAAVVRKLIRVAWKCYHQSNFATLTQIVLGLQSPWVERLAKTWARVGALELRMLRDLKAFINPARNFRHLRNAMREMIVQGHMEDLIVSSGPPQSRSGSGLALNDGCIPFFGLFLSDLAMQDSLPTFVEPEGGMDGDAETHAADSRASEYLPVVPVGDCVPLVNLYKYRILATTVKSVLALQERLAAFNFPVNRSVYVKALKLRCLEAKHLATVSHMAES